MDDIKTLLRDGDDKFDRNDFAGALAAYRAALLSGDSRSVLLDNIHLASDHELLALIRQARAQSPSSTAWLMLEAQQRVRMRDSEGAVELYGQLLADVTDEKAIVPLRLARHQAGAQHGAATLADDFEYLWRLGEHNGAMRPFRRSLLRQLLAIDRVEAIPSLQSIVARLADAPDVAALVTTKIRELEAYAALEKSPALQRDARK